MYFLIMNKRCMYGHSYFENNHDRAGNICSTTSLHVQEWFLILWIFNFDFFLILYMSINLKWLENFRPRSLPVIGWKTWTCLDIFYGCFSYSCMYFKYSNKQLSRTRDKSCSCKADALASETASWNVHCTRFLHGQEYI